MLFASTEIAMNSLIFAGTGLLLIITQILTAWFADKRAAASAQHQEEMKNVLVTTTKTTEGKLDAIAKVADQTHVLVNSNMGVQLKLNAELSRWKAGQTKLPADEEAAEKAERSLVEHERKQAVVDNQAK